jgi:hypothetical protein
MDGLEQASNVHAQVQPRLTSSLRCLQGGQVSVGEPQNCGMIMESKLVVRQAARSQSKRTVEER